MNVELLFDEQYKGETIIELESIIRNITDKRIKIRWNNTRDEITALKQYPDLHFSLIVTEPGVMERTIATFGKRLTISASTLERAKLVLTDFKGYDWRNFVSQSTAVNPRYVLLQMIADAVRRGKSPVALVQVLESVWLKHTSCDDADVLLRIRLKSFRG